MQVMLGLGAAARFVTIVKNNVFHLNNFPYKHVKVHSMIAACELAMN